LKGQTLVSIPQTVLWGPNTNGPDKEGLHHPKTLDHQEMPMVLVQVRSLLF